MAATTKTAVKAVAQITIVDGKKYITAVARGTEYTLMKLGDAWFVSSHRLALGRFNVGGGKHYETLAAVAEGCKAFGAEAEIFKLFYGFDIATAINA
ncbi:MAG: hypothetical protein JO200_08450 [Comamonas sp.]|nr:hypothetical protein [Comamonas sp.]